MKKFVVKFVWLSDWTAASPLRYTGRQIGDLCGKFSRQILFPLAMATKMVAAWSAAYHDICYWFN